MLGGGCRVEINAGTCEYNSNYNKNNMLTTNNNHNNNNKPQHIACIAPQGGHTLNGRSFRICSLFHPENINPAA